MRVVLQRVTWARVRVGNEQVASIGPGLVALVGVAVGDGLADARRMARRAIGLRVFAADEGGKERSLLESGGALLCVSQFTLLADVRKGTRPSWSPAAPASEAAPLVAAFADEAAAAGVPVSQGRFGAMMALALENDGPVTVIIESAPAGR